jgi:transglutaminase-like putative cysteine protease
MISKRRLGLGWGLLFWATLAHAGPWSVATEEERSLTVEPRAPGAAAIFLDREIDINDYLGTTEVHERIKILGEAGRRFAEVRIYHQRGQELVDHLEVRLISPDGTVRNLANPVLTRPVYEHGPYAADVVAVSPSDVTVGTIVEYRYRFVRFENVRTSRYWPIVADLYARHVEFRFHSALRVNVRLSLPRGLPAGVPPPVQDGDRYTFVADEVPAFVVDPCQPPDAVLRPRIAIDYDVAGTQASADLYWQKTSSTAIHRMNGFVGSTRALQAAAATTTDPTADPGTRLRALYARAQQLRVLEFDPPTTEKEAERLTLRTIEDAADVLKRGAGSQQEVVLLFVGLARAAGFEADAVLVADRRWDFFDPADMRAGDLDGTVARVRLEGQELYLDPGTPLAPFGELDWGHAGVLGLVLAGPTPNWIHTPLRAAADSEQRRTGRLRLLEDGTLEGEVVEQLSGYRALDVRLQLRRLDALGRRDRLESGWSDGLLHRGEARLAGTPDWDSPSPTMTSRYTIRIPNFLSGSAASRAMPTTLYETRHECLAMHESRIHPVYIAYPNVSVDDFTVELPASMQVREVPAGQGIDRKSLVYRISAEADGLTVRLQRRFELHSLLYPPTLGSALRATMQAVRATDGRVVLLTGTASPTPPAAPPRGP